MLRTEQEVTEKDAIVYRVTTLAEAAVMWKLKPSSIMYHILRGRIAARKSCVSWLVSHQSMVDFYGQPKLPFQDLEK